MPFRRCRARHPESRRASSVYGRPKATWTLLCAHGSTPRDRPRSSCPTQEDIFTIRVESGQPRNDSAVGMDRVLRMLLTDEVAHLRSPEWCVIYIQKKSNDTSYISGALQAFRLLQSKVCTAECGYRYTIQRLKNATILTTYSTICKVQYYRRL